MPAKFSTVGSVPDDVRFCPDNLARFQTICRRSLFSSADNSPPNTSTFVVRISIRESQRRSRGGLFSAESARISCGFRLLGQDIASDGKRAAFAATSCSGRTEWSATTGDRLRLPAPAAATIATSKPSRRQTFIKERVRRERVSTCCTKMILLDGQIHWQFVQQFTQNDFVAARRSHASSQRSVFPLRITVNSCRRDSSRVRSYSS